MRSICPAFSAPRLRRCASTPRRSSSDIVLSPRSMYSRSMSMLLSVAVVACSSVLRAMRAVLQNVESPRLCDSPSIAEHAEAQVERCIVRHDRDAVGPRKCRPHHRLVIGGKEIPGKAALFLCLGRAGPALAPLPDWMAVKISQVDLAAPAQPQRSLRRRPCLRRERQLHVAAAGMFGRDLRRYFDENLGRAQIPPQLADQNAARLRSFMRVRLRR